MRHSKRFLPFFALLLVHATAFGISITPNTTLLAETSNNSSTATSFTGTSNGNIAPRNVSKVDTRTLMYPGSTTNLYVHLMMWFGNSSHIGVGYNSSDPIQIQKQVTDLLSRGIQGGEGLRG